MYMWSNAPIRWKLMLAFALVILVPMAAIVSVGSAIIRQIMSQHEESEITSAEIYALATLEDYKTKSKNYVRLLIRDYLIQNAAYYATMPKESPATEKKAPAETAPRSKEPGAPEDESKLFQGELTKLILAISKDFDLDAVEVGDKRGKVVASAPSAEDLGADRIGWKLISDALANRISVDLRSDAKGRLAIQAAGPLQNQGETVGAIMISTDLDNQLAEALKRLVNAEIVILSETSVLASTIQDFHLQAADKKTIAEVKQTGESVYGNVDFLGQPYTVAYTPVHNAEGQVLGVLLIGLNRTENIAAQNRNLWISLSILIAGSILAVGLGALIARGIARPMRALSDVAGIIGKKGDLSHEIPTGTRGGSAEMGQLTESFREMQTSLRQMARRVKEGTLQIASASTQILAASTEQASGAQEHAASVAETTAAMEELSVTARQIADNTGEVADMANQTLSSAQGGQEAVRNAISGMEQIGQASRDSAARILNLREKSQQIGNTIQIIDDIADQTNMLALNAAIEAARAGEAGKGFAVVATEVRRLAENVVESTKEIKDVITEIQASMNSLVMATEQGTKNVESGMERARVADKSLAAILDTAVQTANACKEISVATQQQRSGSEQVAAAIREMAKMAEHSAAGSRQATAAAESLNGLAGELSHVIAGYKLD